MFKFVVVLSLVAIVVAQHHHHDSHSDHDSDHHHGNSEDAHAEIKQLHSDINEHGFHYDFETSNHIKVSADGDEHGNIHGDFDWIAPKGQHVDVKYVADEYGYQPKVSYSHK